jgi:hypothetical protein
MVITKKAQWTKYSVHRGVQIFKRVAGTGTSQGSWLAAGCYYASLKRAVAGIEAIPEINLQHYLQK